jgi:hypothetical protein
MSGLPLATSTAPHGMNFLGIVLVQVCPATAPVTFDTKPAVISTLSSDYFDMDKEVQIIHFGRWFASEISTIDRYPAQPFLFWHPRLIALACGRFTAMQAIGQGNETFLKDVMI